MDLHYYLLRCPYCLKVWGRTEEYSEDITDEGGELVENAICPACKKQQQSAKVANQKSSE